MDVKSFFLWNRGRKEALCTLLILAAVLGWLLRTTYAPGHVAFSNDGPVGRLMSQCHQLPQAFTGVWQDLNSVGYREGGALPNITFGLRWLLGPMLFAKLFPFLALLVLGMGAWCFFRQLALAPLACFLGALAAVLNSSFFSAACWGVGSHAITIGMCFFALAAIADPSARPRWLRLALAGLALGMCVSEGADIGAMFSLYAAGFVLYQALVREGRPAANLAVGLGRVMLIAGVAAFLAAQTISVLIDTQIKGVSSAQQTAPTGEDRWYWATKWSLPKREALGLLIPGLFGYRVDTPHGGEYWGAAGRDQAWARYLEAGGQGEAPKGVIRFTGGGNYTGILVVLIALWAAFQALRQQNSVFSSPKRHWIWFWSGQAVVSLLLAFGRFAPFYRLLYELPFASTVRNPAKFVHPVNFALVVLFAYGVHGLSKHFLEKPAGQRRGLYETLTIWWREARGFDRGWVIGCMTALGLSVAGWFAYSGNSDALESYLREVKFEPAMAQAIANFSVAQVAWFVVVFTSATVLLFLILSGALRANLAGWAGLALAGFLVFDLGSADQPWVIGVDFKEKYAGNPIIEALCNDVHGHRVAILPFLSGPQDALLDRVYHVEWMQHQFPLNDIQSLDIVQMSRVPQDLAAFDQALQFEWSTNTIYRLTRRWELTNTRYLLGAAALLDVLNREVDPGRQRFSIIARFNLVPQEANVREDQSDKYAVALAPDGQYALFEFKGVLPRARLYTNWVVETNDTAALQVAAGPLFDPETSVLVSSPLPTAPPSEPVRPSEGTVAYESYAPRDIVLQANASRPGVLLLNDRIDPSWEVLVDGIKGAVLRCNFLMRGVYLDQGAHRIEFRFRPPSGPLYVSLAAIGIGILLLGLLCVTESRKGRLVQAPGPKHAGRRVPENAQLRPT